MLALREFGITDPSSHYSLCEVSVESESVIKQKRLPDQMTGLPDRIHMSGRYYIKNNMSTEPLVPDEMMCDLLKDSAVQFLQLNSAEVAAQLTLRDFQYFHLIEPTEYMDDLFELESTFGDENLQRFSEVCSGCLIHILFYGLFKPHRKAIFYGSSVIFELHSHVLALFLKGVNHQLVLFNPVLALVYTSAPYHIVSF